METAVIVTIASSAVFAIGLFFLSVLVAVRSVIEALRKEASAFRRQVEDQAEAMMTDEQRARLAAWRSEQDARLVDYDGGGW